MAIGKLYIGRKVRELRQTNKATQAQFAERIGISVSYLNQIENNQRPVSASVLLALAEKHVAVLRRLGLSVALPIVSQEVGVMDFHLWQPEDDLVPGPFDIPQPHASAPMADPDVIFTPLVAFDATLSRLGQGGGYYDRVFARYPDALRIGLAWSVQQVAHVPLESWDYPLHFVLTERALIEREDAQ